jgi:upstream activation factor subunit UAF30
MAKKKAKKGARKGAKKAAKKKGGAKRKPNAAFMKPMQPDAALGAVVGNTAIPRTEVTKKLWAYIKRNGLQDAKERRMINADDKLRAVFGGKGKVSMFEMTKLVSKHMK